MYCYFICLAIYYIIHTSSLVIKEVFDALSGSFKVSPKLFEDFPSHFYVRLLDDIGPRVVEADDLHVVDNLVWLVHAPVVKAAKDVFTRSIDCSSQQKVGEKQLVAFVVQFIISIRRHGPVPLGGHFFQVVPGESGEILVEVAQRLSSDIVHAHLATDHIEDHPGDKLNPDGEVINTSTALAHPGPHVKPGGEGDGVNDHLAGGKSLTPTSLLQTLLVPLRQHLFQETLKEDPVVVDHVYVLCVLLPPPG